MVINMDCPYCNSEMEKGYINTDGRYIAWRKEKHESAKVKKNEEGIQLGKKYVSACNLENAYCCKTCKKIIIEYTE